MQINNLLVFFARCIARRDTPININLIPEYKSGNRGIRSREKDDAGESISILYLENGNTHPESNAREEEVSRDVVILCPLLPFDPPE
jgi:hypothetical protein